MKKALFSILALVGMCITFTSCGESALEAKPESTTVGGKWGKAFTIEDKAYPFVVADEKDNGKIKAEINITLTRVDAATEINLDNISDWYDVTKKYKGELIIEFLDADGSVLCDEDAYGDDIEKLLQASIGDKVTVKFKIDEQKDLVQKICKFRLTTKADKNDGYDPFAATGDEEVEEVVEETESIFD